MATQPDESKPTIVLVHGAWADATGFDAEIRVTREGHSVGGTSIMGLMMLSAGPGTSITVSAIGPEAQAAIDAAKTELRDLELKSSVKFENA